MLLELYYVSNVFWTQKYIRVTTRASLLSVVTCTLKVLKDSDPYLSLLHSSIVFAFGESPSAGLRLRGMLVSPSTRSHFDIPLSPACCPLHHLRVGLSLPHSSVLGSRASIFEVVGCTWRMKTSEYLGTSKQEQGFLRTSLSHECES